ncbi:hypothetical protein C1645_820972 [Glomus cerebriforme]|uniref:NYN domain-containing protein n=1 Tax=Glomus cerebriforme TaxID=658196 RepID=A0A397T7E6_9GLOM|nr:hypothetical protein C1645_820972 [Glomus cerebriforme]
MSNINEDTESTIEKNKLFSEIIRLGFTGTEKRSMFSYFNYQPDTIITRTLYYLSFLEDEGKIELLKCAILNKSIKIYSGSCDDVYIFIDDSNLYIEGKYVVGGLENLGVFDRNRGRLRFDQLRIDYGRILRQIQNGRTLGDNPIIVGSVLPNDTLWNHIRNEGFKVKTFPRNLTHYIDLVILNKVPAVLALVARDVDYMPCLKTAIKLGWKLEIYFWNYGLSGHLFDLKPKPVFTPLDGFYKIFTYGYGPKGNNNTKILELSGNGLYHLNDIMDFFNSLNIFGFWYQYHDLLRMYFKNMTDIQRAESLIRNNYPEIDILINLI